jgi:adenylate cyclase
LSPTAIVLWAVGFTFACLALSDATGALPRLNAILDDHSFWLARKLAPPSPPSQVVIVALDDAAITAIDRPLALAHTAFATVLDRIAQAKPRAVVLDLSLPSKDYAALAQGGTEQLAQAISRVNTCCASAYAVTINSDGQVQPLPARLVEAMGEARMGLATWQLDSDQSVRRFAPLRDERGQPVPLLIEAAHTALNISVTEQPINFHPVSHWQTLSMRDLLASDVAQTTINTRLQGKVVVIGSVLPFDDRYRQPIAISMAIATNAEQRQIATSLKQVSALAPGVTLYAQWLETQLTNQGLRASRWLDWGAALAFAALVATLTVRRTGWGVALAATLLIALPFVTAWLIKQLWLWSYGVSLIAILLSCALTLGYKALRNHAERQSLERAFAGYVSPALLTAIINRDIDPREPTRMHIASLFIDLRDSSTLTQTLKPDRMVALLNRFFDVVVQAIHSHDGVVDNFRGDGVMAFFGAPRLSKSPVAQAIAALDDLYESIYQLNLRLHDEGFPHIRVAVGLCYGDVITVNVGSKARNNYTAIGNSVNEAARLQEIAKQQQSDIVRQGTDPIDLRSMAFSVALSDSAYNEAQQELLASALNRMIEIATMELRGVGQHRVFLYRPLTKTAK